MGTSYGWFYQQYREGIDNPQTQADMEFELDRAKPLGAWVMGNCEWRRVNHVPGVYEWDYVDTWVQRANARGFKVILSLNFTASWARPLEFQEPDVWSWDVDKSHAAPARYREQEWRKYCRDVAERYSRHPYHVHHYSIGNEMNAQYFYTTNDSSMSYATYLRIAAEEIRAVDPEAFIITGGLWPRAESDTTHPVRVNRIINPAEWLSKLYEQDPRIGECFDALGYHPYARRVATREGQQYGPSYDFGDMAATRPVVPGDPGPHDPRALFLFTENLHEVMRVHGDTLITRSGRTERKRIWGTEYGLPTGQVHGPNVTGDPTFGRPDTASMFASDPAEEAVQAAWIDDYLSRWFEWDFTGPLLFFTLRDRVPALKYPDYTARDHGSPEQYQWYGVFTNLDWRPKPAWFELLEWASGRNDIHVGGNADFVHHDADPGFVDHVREAAGVQDTVTIHIHAAAALYDSLDFAGLHLGSLPSPNRLRCLWIVGAGPRAVDGLPTDSGLPRISMTDGLDLPEGVGLVLENLCFESGYPPGFAGLETTGHLMIRNCGFRRCRSTGDSPNKARGIGQPD